MKNTIFITAVALVGLVVSCWQNTPSPVATGDLEIGSPGHKVYQKHCATCHHPNRIGKVGPPLLPQFLRRKKDRQLEKIITHGLPATQMAGFPQIQKGQLIELISYLRKPGKVAWSPQDIARSRREILGQSTKTYQVDNRDNLTVVVARGTNEILIVEGDRVLDRFSFANVHGGVKFSPRGDVFYVPGRDGWIGKYDLKEKRYYGRIRAGVYLRNIALSPDGKYLLAACRLPQSIAVLDSYTLKPVKSLPLPGKISALYPMVGKNQCLFTLRDKGKLGLVDIDSLTISYREMADPMEDFFIDPQDRYLIGSTRRGKLLQVYDLVQDKVVFKHPTPGMPHLFSAAFWYRDGEFYFATPHMRQPCLTVWKMYQWAFVDKIDIGGDGFFVRTHGQSPYLWADNGSDQLVLVDKTTYQTKFITPKKGQKVLHTEFSGDGQIAYISLFSPRGGLALYDTSTLEQRGHIRCSLPVGKYNYRNKSRRFHLAELGQEVFMKKCWGCHHPTEKAFGPSFLSIAKTRSEGWIRAQLANPKIAAKHLGYKRSAMPKISLSEDEIKALLAAMRDIHSKSKSQPRQDLDR